jgi:molybdenum cofactor guanylyltransferase
MGRDKASIEIGGVPLAVRVARALEAGGCRSVSFVGDTAVGGYPIVADRFPGEGPLGGVLTALAAHAGDVVVAACDLPNLDEVAVRALLAADPDRRWPVVAAVADGHHVPMARWRREVAPALEAAFAAGTRSWRAALDAVGALEVPIDARSALDLDSPADVEALGGSGPAPHQEPPAEHG